VLKSILTLLATVTPFTAETIFLNFKKEFGLKQESVQLYDWPKHDKKMVNHKLEKNMDMVKDIINGALGAREKAQTGIRWPLQEVIIEVSDKEATEAVNKLSDLIKSQVNVKSIKIVKKFDKADTVIKPNYKTLGPDFGKESQTIVKELSNTDNTKLLKNYKNGKLKLGKHVLENKHLVFEKTLAKGYHMGNSNNGNVYLNTDVSNELVSEGYYRELVRRIQSFRKDAGLKKTDNIELYLKLDKKLFDILVEFEPKIKDRVGATSIDMSTISPTKKYKFNNKESIKGLKVVAGFVVV